MNDSFHELIKNAASKRIVYSRHSLTQMIRPDRMVEIAEVRALVFEGEIIEDYPDDSRGHSCLMLGNGIDNRAIHVVCAPKEDFWAIVTAYPPDPVIWLENFKKRK